MSLKLEKGKFYKHEKGRCIAVLDDVDTYKWGKLLVVEETDHTGHSISCVDGEAEDLHERWIEISKDEWLMEFNGVLAN
jgi:hypothetical protein